MITALFVVLLCFLAGSALLAYLLYKARTGKSSFDFHDAIREFGVLLLGASIALSVLFLQEFLQQRGELADKNTRAEANGRTLMFASNQAIRRIASLETKLSDYNEQCKSVWPRLEFIELYSAGYRMLYDLSQLYIIIPDFQSDNLFERLRLGEFDGVFVGRFLWEFDTLAALRNLGRDEGSRSFDSYGLYFPIFTNQTSTAVVEKMTLSLREQLCSLVPQFHETATASKLLLERIFVRSCFIRHVIAGNDPEISFEESDADSVWDEKRDWIAEKAARFPELKCGSRNASSNVFDDVFSARKG